VGGDRGEGGPLVVGEAGRPPRRRAQAPLDPGADRRVVGVTDGDRPTQRQGSLPATADHADLEGQQLIEGEALESSVASLERGRVVRFFKGTSDRDEALLSADVRGQVFGVAMSGAIESLAHRRPEAGGRQSRGQRIDGHDAPGMEDRGTVVALEFGVVERQAPAELPQLPADDHRVAGPQPPFDVPAPEPGGIGRAGVVLKDGDGPLDTAAERGLDPQVGDANPRRYNRAVGCPDEVAQAAHLTKVVVSTRQVEQQVPNRLEPKAPAGTTKHGRRGQPGAAQIGIEEANRIRGHRAQNGPRGTRP